jgi:hypothetical protein
MDDDAMALTPTEAKILALADAGHNRHQIARAGFSKTRVRSVLGTYGSAASDRAESQRHRAAMAQASQALAAAIRNAASPSVIPASPSVIPAKAGTQPQQTGA